MRSPDTPGEARTANAICAARLASGAKPRAIIPTIKLCVLPIFKPKPTHLIPDHPILDRPKPAQPKLAQLKPAQQKSAQPKPEATQQHSEVLQSSQFQTRAKPIAGFTPIIIKSEPRSSSHTAIPISSSESTFGSSSKITSCSSDSRRAFKSRSLRHAYSQDRRDAQRKHSREDIIYPPISSVERSGEHKTPTSNVRACRHKRTISPANERNNNNPRSRNRNRNSSDKKNKHKHSEGGHKEDNEHKRCGRHRGPSEDDTRDRSDRRREITEKSHNRSDKKRTDGNHKSSGTKRRRHRERNKERHKDTQEDNKSHRSTNQSLKEVTAEDGCYYYQTTLERQTTKDWLTGDSDEYTQFALQRRNQSQLYQSYYQSYSQSQDFNQSYSQSQDFNQRHSQSRAQDYQPNQSRTYDIEREIRRRRYLSQTHEANIRSMTQDLERGWRKRNE